MVTPFEMMTLQYFRFHVALRSCPLQLHLLSCRNSEPWWNSTAGAVPQVLCTAAAPPLPPSQKPLSDGAWQKSAAIGKDFPP